MRKMLGIWFARAVRTKGLSRTGGNIDRKIAYRCPIRGKVKSSNGTR